MPSADFLIICDDKNALKYFYKNVYKNMYKNLLRLFVVIIMFKFEVLLEGFGGRK